MTTSNQVAMVLGYWFLAGVILMLAIVGWRCVKDWYWRRVGSVKRARYPGTLFTAPTQGDPAAKAEIDALEAAYAAPARLLGGES